VIEKQEYSIAAIMELPVGIFYTWHMAGACPNAVLAYAAGGSQESANYSWETNIVQEPARYGFWLVSYLLNINLYWYTRMF
jgi:hypothetical protein